MKRVAALELKDASETDPVELVTKSLNDFQAAYDARLKEVETKTANDNKLADRLNAIEAKMNRPGSTPKHANDNDAQFERKALNEFMRGHAANLGDLERKALNWGTPSAGGYVTAPEYSKTVVENLVQFSPLRGLASTMTIGTEKVLLPVLDTRLSSAWVTETGTRTESQPVFDQMSIDVFEQAVIVPLSRQLMDDAFIDLASYVSGQIATKFAVTEASAFLKGDGSGKPTGLLKTPADYTAITAAADGSDILAQVIAAFYALPNAYASNGSWLMNRTMQGVIRAAADNATKGTLWSDSLANGTPATLLGRPVYDAPDMDSLPTATGTKYPIAFGDFKSAYQIVDRNPGIELMRDDYTGADNGIVKIRARRRVGGAPVLTESVILVKSVKA